MGDPLQDLPDVELRHLAAALKCGRLIPPFTTAALGRIVSAAAAGPVAMRCGELHTDGLRPAHIGTVIETILVTRSLRPAVDDVVQLVWTGPEPAGVESRDTGVVVRELFAEAQDTVLVAGFAVYQGREVFKGLAARMVERPGLRVRLYLDVQRPHQDTSGDEDIVRRFAENFVSREWPGDSPLPEIYYDPRSLDVTPSKKSRLHAKCVVIDRRTAFVSSANFTEAAQCRNIEVGVLVHSARLASRLSDHFERLQEVGQLCSVPLRRFG